jgi:hypothetical protein
MTMSIPKIGVGKSDSDKMVVSTVHACLHLLVSAEKVKTIYYNAAQKTVLFKNFKSRTILRVRG